VYAGNFWKVDCVKHYVASNDGFWIEHFRMNIDSFDELVEIVEPHLNPKRGPKPDAQLLVVVALSYLSHGATFTQLRKDFGTPRGTSWRYITRFVDILVDQRADHIYWPSTAQEFQQSAKKFQDMRGLPYIVGCIDGSHVYIPEVGLETSTRALDWINRKGSYSMQVQAVCDADLLFLDIDIGWPGSVHDARVLSNSDLQSDADSRTLFPAGLPKFRLPNGTLTGYQVLADLAHPLEYWIMPPFKHRGVLCADKLYFNTSTPTPV